MSLPFPPLALRRLVGPIVDDSYYDNPTGDYTAGPLDIGPLAPGQAYERVLDFGCGPGRDARRLLLQRERPKSYVGVDVNRLMIDWCRENLSFDGFRFVHHDVWSPTYGLDNSKNRYLPLTPLGSDFTLINANSVFTHLLEDQVEFYLREMSSMLAPTGIIHGSWFFFSKKWFPMMGDRQNTIFVNEHDATQAVYYDWYYFRSLLRSLGLRIAEVKWTKVPGFHNVLTLAKSELFPDLEDKIHPPSSVIGFSRSESFYSLPESKQEISGTAASEVRVQQVATDLLAAQAELERLLAEEKLQDERIASLTAERDHWAQQHAAERDRWAQQHAALHSSNEQTVRLLSARLEEGAAEKEVLKAKYERSQAEHQKLTAANRTLEARLEASDARLRALAADKRSADEKVRALTAENRELGAKLNDAITELNLSLSRLNSILGSRAWKALSPYRKARDVLSRLRPRLLRDLNLIRRSGLFDEPWYLSQYPDVRKAGVDPLMHYLQSGAAEGRDPNPYFDSDWYLRNNPDVAAAGINPLRHYLHNGASEQRDPCPAFDTKKYLEKHPEVAAGKLNPLAHFLSSRKPG